MIYIKTWMIFLRFPHIAFICYCSPNCLIHGRLWYRRPPLAAGPAVGPRMMPGPPAAVQLLSPGPPTRRLHFNPYFLCSSAAAAVIGCRRKAWQRVFIDRNRWAIFHLSIAYEAHLLLKKYQQRSELQFPKVKGTVERVANKGWQMKV